MGHAYGIKNFQLQKRLRSTGQLDNAIQDLRDKANKRASKSVIKKRMLESAEFAALVAETRKKAEAAQEAKRLAREQTSQRNAAKKAKRAAKKAAKRFSRLAKREPYKKAK